MNNYFNNSFKQKIILTLITAVSSALITLIFSYTFQKWEEKKDGEKWLQIFAIEIKNYHGSDIICQYIKDVKNKINNIDNLNLFDNKLLLPDAVLSVPSIYSSNLNKIGLLKEDDAENIINFHTSYKNSIIMLSESSTFNKLGFTPKTLDALLENLMEAERYKRKVLNSANIEYLPKCNTD